MGKILPDSDPDVAAYLTAHNAAVALRAQYDTAVQNYVSVLAQLKALSDSAHAARAKLLKRGAEASVDGRGWPGQSDFAYSVLDVAVVPSMSVGGPQWPVGVALR